ncbi:MAG: hypothetical protein ACRCTE_06340 [Cellulosilyticaceae bacterium]
MNKWIKKVGAICGAMILMVGTVIANPMPLKQTTQFEVNEYVLIKELKKESSQTLKAKGFSDEEINNLQKFDFKKELFNRNQIHSDQELKIMGYNDQEIVMLRNFKGTESEMMNLTRNTFSIDLWKYSSQASSSISRLTMSYDWNWSKQPIWNNVDLIAFAWSKGYSSDAANSYATAKYYGFDNYGNQKIITKKYGLYDKVPGSGCSIKVPLVIGDLAGSYCKSGTGRISLYDNSLISNAEVRVEYGHRQFTGTPTVSFLGGVDMEFNYGTNSVGFDNYEYRQ